MEHMKKSWEKIIKNHSGSSGRQSCIVVCCGSVYRAEWDHYGRCDWYRSYDQPLFSGKPIDDYLAINAVLFVLGAVFLGKKFALTTIISSFIIQYSCRWHSPFRE